MDSGLLPEHAFNRLATRSTSSFDVARQHTPLRRIRTSSLLSAGRILRGWTRSCP
jgi:hypothetical protein